MQQPFSRLSRRCALVSAPCPAQLPLHSTARPLLCQPSALHRRRSCQRLLCKAVSPPFTAMSAFRLLHWPTGLPALVLPTFLVSVGAAWIDRPRGWADRSLVQEGTSAVHGRGVFARVDLQPGSTIGIYPGRPRSAADMAAKAKAAPACKGYTFHTSGGSYLDPTDSRGKPSRHPRSSTGFSLPWLPIDPLLAYVNEPPPGRLTNVSVVDGADDLELVFVVTADVAAGEEIFVDYGLTFDRSSYDG